MSDEAERLVDEYGLHEYMAGQSGGDCDQGPTRTALLTYIRAYVETLDLWKTEAVESRAIIADLRAQLQAKDPEIARLKERLEIPIDPDFAHIDGIECRNETIAWLDEQVATLRAQLQAKDADARRYQWLLKRRFLLPGVIDEVQLATGRLNTPELINKAIDAAIAPPEQQT